MRWHDDEIGGNSLPKPADFIEGRCATEHIAGRGRDAAFTSDLLEVFERGLFSVLLVWHEGKWAVRRGRCQKTRAVINMTNMGEMYRSAQTPSQSLRDLNR